MKIIFLSHLYPRTRRDEYLKNSKAGLAAAADAHQYAIALGLNEVCDDFTIVNVPALFYYPFRYKKCRIPDEVITENGLTIHNVGYNLLMEYTFISQYRGMVDTLKNVINQSNDKDVYIVVYGIKSPALKAALKMKSVYSNLNIKVSEIIPDLPQDVNTHGSMLSSALSLLRYSYNRPATHYFKQIDSFVLLTDFMKEVVGCAPEKYIVSEGIYEEAVTKRIPHQEDSDTFTIFYGGMLYEKFGIMNLVNAFCSINNPKMRLQLCGYGDCVERVKELSKTDYRIQYLGVVSRDEVLDLQSKASLLVNPRVPDGNPFTRYSFPSKTMEYLASATPTLIYQLEGIPEEYYKYCYSLDSNHTTVNDLTSIILSIHNTPVAERLELGRAARKFILEEKNQLIAGKQILELLKRTI